MNSIKCLFKMHVFSNQSFLHLTKILGNSVSILDIPRKPMSITDMHFVINEKQIKNNFGDTYSLFCLTEEKFIPCIFSHNNLFTVNFMLIIPLSFRISI